MCVREGGGRKMGERDRENERGEGGRKRMWSDRSRERGDGVKLVGGGGGGRVSFRRPLMELGLRQAPVSVPRSAPGGSQSPDYALARQPSRSRDLRPGRGTGPSRRTAAELERVSTVGKTAVARSSREGRPVQRWVTALGF